MTSLKKTSKKTQKNFRQKENDLQKGKLRYQVRLQEDKEKQLEVKEYNDSRKI